MSTLIGDTLPAPVSALLTDSARDDTAGQCFYLFTTDPDGQPRPCLLSVGEILHQTDRLLRIVVWPDSATTTNLDVGRPVLLSCVAAPYAYHIKATPTRLPDAPGCALARFELHVHAVERDGHDGFPMTSPATFAARPDTAQRLRAMWRDQLQALAY